MNRKNYRELIVWQKSVDLVIAIYSITKIFPREEQFGLVSQLRRAAVSIPSNIAEGNSRNTTKEYIQFLYVALGSKAEVETQLEICLRLNYLDSKQMELALGLCEEVGKMLNRIIQKLTPKS